MRLRRVCSTLQLHTAAVCARTVSVSVVVSDGDTEAEGLAEVDGDTLDEAVSLELGDTEGDTESEALCRSKESVGRWNVTYIFCDGGSETRQ